MKIKTIFFVLFSYAFSQANPIGIATAGSHKLRMKGQINIFHNPATLGYYVTQSKRNKPNKKALKKSKELAEESVLVSSALSVAEIEKNQKDTDTDSLVRKDPNSENLVGNNLDSLSTKTSGVVLPKDSLLSPSASSKSNFSLSLFSIAFRFGSGSVTPDWINNQLFGGKDLRNNQERKNFIKGISNNIAIQFPVYLSLPLLNFSYGSNAFSLGQVVSHTSINIPSKLAQVPFVGLEKGAELNISSLEIEHITYLPISFSKGITIKPGIIPFGQKSYVGLRSSLLIGISEVHTGNIKGKVQGTETNALIDADIDIGVSLPVQLGDSFPKGSFPVGVGFDLGILTEIDEKLIVGASIDNLFATFNWNNATVYKATITGELTPEEIADSDSLSNLLEQSEIKERSSYKTSLPTSINFSGIYKAEKRVILDANIHIDFGRSYWASSTPLFSLGSEFYPETKTPFYLSFSFGGENNFIWGTGTSLKIGSIIFDISGGQLGGLFNNATGMQFGFGLRLQK